MNYKRKRPRTSASNRTVKSMHSWPRWWDIVFHTRPKRREDSRTVQGIKRGDDPDNATFNTKNHAPHTYFW